jgi:hypothetical protein
MKFLDAWQRRAKLPAPDAPTIDALALSPHLVLKLQMVKAR